MTAPLDVKISYKNEIILVSDSVNGRFMVFDLNSGKYESDCYPAKKPWQFVLEQNYDGENEALICSTGNNYLKYDLLELVNSTKTKKAKVIWKTKYEVSSCFQSSVIKYSNTGNTLYCCNSSDGLIAVYSCKDGSLVRNISLVLSFNQNPESLPISFTLNRPVGIDYISNSGACEFVVAMMGDSVFYVRESPDETWVLRNKLETTLEIDNENQQEIMAMPCAAWIDRNNQNVIICSYGTSSMVIFSKEGNFLKSYGERGTLGNDTFMDQTGCCINELTGELLIVDSHNNRVQIYK